MILKDIVYFVTKQIPEYISAKFQRQEKPKQKREKNNWIEDFDERERNSR